jgi:mRNA interferase MazF
MVDKISTLPKYKLGRRIGRLDAEDVSLLNRSVALFLGLAE